MIMNNEFDPTEPDVVVDSQYFKERTKKYPETYADKVFMTAVGVGCLVPTLTIGLAIAFAIACWGLSMWSS